MREKSTTQRATQIAAMDFWSPVVASNSSGRFLYANHAKQAKQRVSHPIIFSVFGGLRGIKH
jgi:hypothetical protein